MSITPASTTPEPSGQSIELSNPSEKGGRQYYFILALVMALSVAVQWFYHEPKLNTDAQIWLNIGKSLWSQGTPHYSSFYYERIFFTSFLWVVGHVVPLTTKGILPVILALSATCIWLVAETARVVAGRTAGLLAGALFASHPIVLTFSSFLVSDTLSLPLSLTALYLTARFIQERQFPTILAATFIGGACFFVKSYTAVFGLAAIAAYVGITIVHRKFKFQQLIWLAIAFAMPIVLGHFGHWLMFGDAFFYKKYYADYATRVYGQTGLTLRDLFGPELLKLLLERSDYLSQLFDKSGALAGVWGLFAIVAMLHRFRASAFHALLAVVFVILAGFLLFAPVRMSPLVLVEMQTRYLTLPIALMAIGAGTLLKLRAEPAQLAPLRTEMLAVATLFMLAGTLTPNTNAAANDGHFHRYRVLDAYAVRQLAETHPSAQKLVLPLRYKEMFLEDLLPAGRQVEFMDLDQLQANAQAQQELTRCNCALFIPRVQFPGLSEELRIKGLPDISELGPHAPLVRQLESAGFKRVALQVPYTPIRRLGADRGLSTKGALVGWALIPPKP